MAGVGRRERKGRGQRERRRTREHGELVLRRMPREIRDDRGLGPGTPRQRPRRRENLGHGTTSDAQTRDKSRTRRSNKRFVE